MKVSYQATGTLLGRLWGGGEGSYPTITITGDSLKDIKGQAKSMLASGVLDSGMGFDGLIGAIMQVTKTTTKSIKGKEYTRQDYNHFTVGHLTQKQISFIWDCEVMAY